MRRRSRLAALATTLLSSSGLWFATAPPGRTAAVPAPAVPFGSHSFSYVSGTLKPSGDQRTNDQRVIDFYQRWKTNFVRRNCGNGWYEVYAADASYPYVAEAQGYGMVITAIMAGADPEAQTIFDGILKYVLAHPSANNPDLHAAEQDSACRSVNASNSATDGDLDIAYSLLLADRQWGSSGTFDYKTLAMKRINAIKESELHPTTMLMKLGDWSSGSYDSVSRSSDWMPGHFKAFRKATGDSTWDVVLNKHQSLIGVIQSQYSPGTGLLPDFVVDTTTDPKPAAGKILEGPHDGDYHWNACRDPWRIGTDAVVNGDIQSRTAARKISSWAESKTGGDPSKIRSGYELNGTAYGEGSAPAFFAPFAVAAMTDGGSQAWLDALWQQMLDTQPTPTSYYSSSLQLQSMLVVTHNYWSP